MTNMIKIKKIAALATGIMILSAGCALAAPQGGPRPGGQGGPAPRMETPRHEAPAPRHAPEPVHPAPRYIAPPAPAPIVVVPAPSNGLETAILGAGETIGYDITSRLLGN